MSDLISVWQEGGAAMYLVAALGLAAFALAAIAALYRAHGAANFAAIALMATMAAGALGTYLGRQATEQALSSLAVAAADAALIRAAGYAEAWRPTQLAGGFTIFVLPLALVAVLRGKPARA